MDSKGLIKLYGEDKYWNINEKEEFMNSTNTLWRGMSSKYTGQTVSTYGPADDADLALVNLLV